MLRRVGVTSQVKMAAPMVAIRAQSDSKGTLYGTEASYSKWFKNPVRQPQLTQEQREKVVIDQEAFPQVFKNYDPADPYKNMPEWIPGMSTVNWMLLGMELAFIVQFYEFVFHPTL